MATSTTLRQAIGNMMACFAPLKSPTFTGNVIVPTPSLDMAAAPKKYVDDAISGISFDTSGLVTIATEQKITGKKTFTAGKVFWSDADTAPSDDLELVPKFYVDQAIADAVSSSSDALPVGAIVMWPKSTIPTGYLLCNGQSFSSTTYPDLYTLLGSTTVPDYRNYYLMGSTTAGTTYSASLPNISGTANLASDVGVFYTTASMSGVFSKTSTTYSKCINPGNGTTYQMSFSASSSNSIYSGSTVRPTTKSVILIIKAA